MAHDGRDQSGKEHTGRKQTAAAVAAVATVTSALLVELAQGSAVTAGDDATHRANTHHHNAQTRVSTADVRTSDASTANANTTDANTTDANTTDASTALVSTARVSTANTGATRAGTARKAAKRLSHNKATEKLRDAGIRWRSTGDCSKRKNPRCTSFRGIRTQVITGITTFERASGCRVIATGGTETGHASGRYSHGNGYKIDIDRNRCVDRYITGSFRNAGKRGDGARVYRATLGRYARESGHWDITYR